MSAFAEASRFFTRVVEAAAATGGWDRPGLGDWSLLELVAHGNRANTLIVEYLTAPQPKAGPDYYTDDAITERARQSVADLGDDPVAAVAAASERAIATVDTAPPDATIGSPVVGTVALTDYAASRIAELLIHGLDIARAAELDFVEPPAEAVRACLHFLTDRALQEGQGLELVLALAGRGSLPGDFTVY